MMLVCVDEAHVGNNKAGKALLDGLKHEITEPTVQIRQMYKGTRATTNYADYIFYSNHQDAMHIESGDRRFNIAPHQETKLNIAEMAALIAGIETELTDFANFLYQYPACETTANMSLDNDAKTIMMENSQTPNDRTLSALQRGKMDYFMSELEHFDHDITRLCNPTAYTETLAALLDSVTDGEAFVTTRGIQILFAVVNGEQQTLKRIATYIGHHANLRIVRMPAKFKKRSAKNPEGVVIKMTQTEEEIEALKIELKGKAQSDTNIVQGAFQVANNNP
jgi:hypothetical protein